MGQKVNPIGLRVGIIRDWDARWYAEGKEFVETLHEDIKVRDFIRRQLPNSGISRIEIERAANRMRVTIHTAKPGVVIGRGGAGIERLRQELDKLTGRQTHINIMEIRVPELDAQLVAESVAAQLEKRVAFRRAMKQAMGRTMRAGAKGVRIMVSGRLGGAEMSRTEWYTDGTVPLHTLRADIDYGFTEAKTTYGQIGVKVWIYKGEILPKQKKAEGAVEGGE
ncbi:MAG: 30S ribosomal protein S3 [Firmicutes bacterium]|nr:30S ribosomal protein S3 [Bacillota bacterium]HPZ90942.1 30S ribosomal protein S3 [Bacillota bacterium]HQE01944.1 30S ribosomal protein S3 [Bacillota bacterium]